MTHWSQRRPPAYRLVRYGVEARPLIKVINTSYYQYVFTVMRSSLLCNSRTVKFVDKYKCYVRTDSVNYFHHCNSKAGICNDNTALLDIILNYNNSTKHAVVNRRLIIYRLKFNAVLTSD